MPAKVSIVIPIYNVEACLPCCLDSVIGQTLREIEIVCVNDGSPDGSLDILKRYAAQDERIRIVSQENRGLGGARNTGLDTAQGEYVLFVDSDDWIDADFCEKLYSAAIRHDAEIVCGGIFKTAPVHSKWVIHYREEAVYEDTAEKFAAAHCPPDFYVMNKLFRRELALHLGLRFREHVAYEDVEFTMRLLCESSLLATVPDTCYQYVMRRNSITKSVQTPLKQREKYEAHMALVAYADIRDIHLDARYRRVTKRFWECCGLTVLKVKECRGVETWRLFDLLPIFRLKAR